MRTLTSLIGQRLFILTIFLFVISIQPSFAETSPAFIKTELKKSEKIWPGQRQTLLVTLYTTVSFSGATRIELPEVSGVIMMESEDRPLLGSEKIDGVSYISKQHEIILFAMRGGSLTVPAFTVEFGYRGADGKIMQQNFSTHELQFTVKEIPGADPHRPVISTRNFHIDDHWQPVPGKAKVGDAFTRTITMTADDLPGMAFPPLVMQKIEGMGQYKKQPQVADAMQRGKFTGKRIETISYVCERKGTFTIVEEHIQWWNPENETLQDVVLKSVVLKVDANPLLQKQTPTDFAVLEANEFPWKWLTVLLLFSGIAGAVFIWQRSRKANQSLQVTNKEKELFDQLQKAAVSHEAAATMQALLHWLDYSGPGGSSLSLARVMELADDSELREQIESLETTLYARDEKRSWSGDKLYSAVQLARKKLKQHKTHGVQQSLPALNP